MELTVPKGIIGLMKREGVKNPIILECGMYGEYEKFDHAALTEAELKILQKIAKDYPVPSLGTPKQVMKMLVRDLENLYRVNTEGAKFKNGQLKVSAEAVRRAIAKTKHRLLFQQDEETGEMNPWVVSDVTYYPPKSRGDDYIPPYVQIIGHAIKRGDAIKDYWTYYNRDLTGGKTAEQLIEGAGAFLETPKLYTEYREVLDYYEEIKDKLGQQFRAIGDVVTDDDDSSWRRRNTVQSLEVGGVPGKVIMDDSVGWDKDNVTVTIPIWADSTFDGEEDVVDPENSEVPEDTDLNTEEDDGEVQTSLTVRLPAHPYVRVFSLHYHIFAIIHCRNLEKYMYQRAIFDKLVVPEITKTIVDALIEERVGDDIIAGKGQGIIILLYGPPGCGKTLSAEAWSEKIKRPLYTVQCSQLGTDPESLEKELGIILQRAERWNALLLIDEADVYIHERGNDVQQNAMVGVFLRLLEYYRGVLFLTTNRGSEIDDAVRSRCIAEIPYQPPTPEQASKIWSIMFKQFEVEEDKEAISQLVHKYPRMTGRTIKHTTRLAKQLATAREQKKDEDKRQKSPQPSIQDFTTAVSFQKLEEGSAKV